MPLWDALSPLSTSCSDFHAKPKVVAGMASVRTAPYLQATAASPVHAVKLVDGDRGHPVSAFRPSPSRPIIVQRAFHDTDQPDRRRDPEWPRQQRSGHRRMMSNIPHFSDMLRLSTSPFESVNSTSTSEATRVRGFNAREDEVRFQGGVRGQRDIGVGARFPVHRLVVGVFGSLSMFAAVHLNVGARGKLNVTEGESVSLRRSRCHPCRHLGIHVVFVRSRPCTNDSSSCAGTNIHAQSALTANCCLLSVSSSYGTSEVRRCQARDSGRRSCSRP